MSGNINKNYHTAQQRIRSEHPQVRDEAVTYALLALFDLLDERLPKPPLLRGRARVNGKNE